MTGREKIEAAFSEAGSPGVPAVVCYEGIYIRDRWDDLTSEPWWTPYSSDLQAQLRAHTQIAERLGQDWYSLPGCASRRDRDETGIEAGPDGVFRVHKPTGRRTPVERPRVGGWHTSRTSQSVHPERAATTPAEIDAALGPPPGDVEDDGSGDLAALMRDAGPWAERFPLRHASSPLWRCHGLWGFEGMMTLVATNPELVRYACQRFLEQSIYVVRLAAAHGARGIWIEECMTDMIGPAAFEQLNLPGIRSLTDTIRELGMRSIYYYCGNPAGKLDMILDAGADAVSLEEDKKGFVIDIEDIVSRASGRCTVLGNLDAIGVLQNGSPEELRTEVARQLAAGRRNGNRFVMSLGSPVTPSTPPSRVHEYCRLTHELGSAGTGA